MAEATQAEAQAAPADCNEFCLRYNDLCAQGKNRQEIADALGMSVKTLTAREHNYRKRGINLEKPASRARGGRRAAIDVEAVNAALAAQAAARK